MLTVKYTVTVEMAYQSGTVFKDLGSESLIA
jgi:hypothetical protein